MDKISSGFNKLEVSMNTLQEKVIADLSSCFSLHYLENALKFYNGLIIETENLRIFFDCENGCGVTRISVKLIEGTEFMQLMADREMYTVPAELQAEIMKFITELSKKAIDCIVKRIPEVKKKSRNDIITIFICLLVSMFISTFHTRLSDMIVSCLNIGSVYQNTATLAVNAVFIITELILIVKSGINSLRLLRYYI